jgi:quinol monooxygenase YgiN
VPAVEKVARYARIVAREGRAEEAAAILLDAAEHMREVAGCELYLVNRQADVPDTLWVTELWSSRADLDAVREHMRSRPSQAASLMELVSDFQMIELDLLGGKGL